jgi:hypothetical protein
MVTQGTLVLAQERSLGPRTEVAIAPGAMLELNFKGRVSVRSLSLDGKNQPPGEYGAAGIPQALTGTGVLVVQP